MSAETEYAVWSTAWFAAWGTDVAYIVNDDEIPLPPIPADHCWVLTREVTSDRSGDHPTYRLALCRGFSDPDETQHKTLGYGHIDKEFYGERGVVGLAHSLKERAGIR